MYVSNLGVVPTLRFRILKYLSWKSPASIKEICEFVGKDRGQVRDKLLQMKGRGQVDSVLTWEFPLGKCRYQVHMYWITSEGLEWVKIFEE